MNEAEKMLLEKINSQIDKLVNDFNDLRVEFTKFKTDMKWSSSSIEASKANCKGQFFSNPIPWAVSCLCLGALIGSEALKKLIGLFVQ